MARIWACGFELGSDDEILSPRGGTSYNTSIVRSGTYSGRVNSLSSGTPKGYDNTFSGGSSSNSYQSVYLYVSTYPSAENTIFAFERAAAPIAYVTLDSGGLLRLYDEDGAIGSASSSVGTGAWKKIDLRLDTTPLTGSHVVEARLDDSVFATSSTRSILLAADRIICGGNISSEAQTQGDWYFDDWKLNNSSGSFENSYPGIGKIIHLKPNAAGDNNAWTRGGADSGSNYGQVDELDPNDATDYVTSNTLNQIDDYNIENSSLSASDTINSIAICMRQRGAGAATNASYVLRAKASSGGTVEESGTLTPSNTTWRTNRFGASPVIYQHVLYDLPGASTTPWSNTDLDNAQIGVRLSATSVNAADVSTLWMAIDYTHSNSSWPGYQGSFGWH